MPTRRILICAFTVLIACSKHNDLVYRVPQELQKHIDAFIKEASLRGISIKIENLIIQYDDKLPDDICGQCNSTRVSNEIQKIISLNSILGSQCWNNELELETLIFHELGHCILGREHLNAHLPNGEPKSIMIESNVSLYSPCHYPIGDPCNKSYKRKYYLDELFDVNTPVPDWGK